MGIQKANKEYICNECYEKIRKGEEYSKPCIIQLDKTKIQLRFHIDCVDNFFKSTYGELSVEYIPLKKTEEK